MAPRLVEIGAPGEQLINGDGLSPVVLVCEHAGREIPATLDCLGLNPNALDSHIAWDIGAGEVSRLLSAKLAAPLVAQRYSRLVYDCNRPPEAPGAMPAISEAIPVPGNQNLTAADRQHRTDEIYRPFHAMIGRVLDGKIKQGLAPVLVTVHSFTPVYHAQPRSVGLGILHDDDSRLADVMLEAAAKFTDVIVRRNDPYGPADGVMHTLMLHGQARGLLNVMIEIRNDFITDPDGQLRWAGVLADLIGFALTVLGDHTNSKKVAVS